MAHWVLWLNRWFDVGVEFFVGASYCSVDALAHTTEPLSFTLFPYATSVLFLVQQQQQQQQQP
jgi:hypothetical protein